jgi:septal ring factor EnvC (AmiA/AmiB activator)
MTRGVNGVPRAAASMRRLSIVAGAVLAAALGGWAPAHAADDVEILQLQDKTAEHDLEIQDSRGRLDLNRGDINRHQADIDDLRHSDNDKASRIAAIEAAIAALQQELADLQQTPGPRRATRPQGRHRRPGSAG